MSSLGLTRLSAAATAFVVVAIATASYFVARTPSDAIGAGPIGRAAPVGTHEEVAYTLEKGRSAGQVGADLERLGVVRSGRQFELVASLMGVQDRLSAGDYTLRKGSAVPGVVTELMVKDSVPVLKVTFPEGIRIEEMAVIAEKAGFGTRQQFLDAVAEARPPAEVETMAPAEGDVPGLRLQGLLFPDTYILPVGATAQNLVDLMLKTFARRFNADLRVAAQSHGLTPYQAVTLASIVEREAVLESERPLIAGVFYNRLAENDMLGADPTVQFAVALNPESVAKYGYWKRDLTAEDLQVVSKYNTRGFAGLPPGPITNPGLASIEAVVHPTPTKYYYFVADARKGDGSHVFAETFTEHQRNIASVGTP